MQRWHWLWRYIFGDFRWRKRTGEKGWPLSCFDEYSQQSRWEIGRYSFSFSALASTPSPVSWGHLPASRNRIHVCVCQASYINDPFPKPKDLSLDLLRFDVFSTQRYSRVPDERFLSRYPGQLGNGNLVYAASWHFFVTSIYRTAVSVTSLIKIFLQTFNI